MALAIFDPLENLAIHERLAQADQHHMLGAFARLAHQPLENLVRHVRLGLLVGLARAHGTIQVALRRGLDDILHRKRVERGLAPQVAPQQFGAVPSSHVNALNGGNLHYGEVRLRMSKVNVAITGASGMIGKRLRERLTSAGDVALVIPRDGTPSACDAIVHLAGEPIGQRWTEAAKKRMYESRVEGTRRLVHALSAQI